MPPKPKKSKTTAKKTAAKKTAKKAAKKPAAKKAAKKSAAKKQTAKKSAAKKRTAKKSAAKKRTAKKSAAKKQTAKKSAAKKQTAKKSAAKKQTAKKSAAKKQTAKKSATKKQTAKKAAKKPVGLDAQLVEAVEDGDVAEVVRLLAAGAPVDACDDEGIPVLLIAVDEDEPDVVNALLDGGVPIDFTDDVLKETPLMTAVARGNLELVSLLLARGADVNYYNDSDEASSPLLVGLDLGRVDRPRVEVLDLLVKAGADVNRADGRGWTPLMLAAYVDDVELLELLLKAGADVRVARGTGIRAIDVAEGQGNAAIMARLLAAGSPTPEESSATRVPALWHMIDAWCQENAAPLHELLAAAPPATEEQIAALEQAIGAPLPPDFRAHLLRFGGSDHARFYEYSGLSVEGILNRWTGLEELRKEGTFATATPHELSADARQVRFQWWHGGWVPFAEDGGGNLYCIDLDPDENGHRGQVIAWEMRGGPVGPYTRSFVDFLATYVDRLDSGACSFDGDSIIRD